MALFMLHFYPGRVQHSAMSLLLDCHQEHVNAGRAHTKNLPPWDFSLLLLVLVVMK